MEATLPALILFMLVLVRLFVLTLRQPQEAAESHVLCRLHRWERTEAGLVCLECGMQPTAE